MIAVLSVENMRRSDAYTIASHVPSRELMFRAGKSVYESVTWRSPVAILCGSGNNAGDGYVLARLLHDDGIACELILLSDKFSEDGAYYFSLCQACGIPIKHWERELSLSDYAMIVDCIFGTGFRGEVSGTAREAISAVNSSGAYVISVDINSGLNGDSGMAELCVRSDLTLSIGGFKSGHFLNMAKDVMQEKRNCDIGIAPLDRPYRLLEEGDLRPLFGPRPAFSHKGTYGYIALIGGSRRYSGAIRLAAMANAAMRSGAGVVKVATPASLADTVAPALLESTLYPLPDHDGALIFSEEALADLIRRVRTIAFGMGVGVTEETEKLLHFLLTHFEGRLIVDADGLTLLSRMNADLPRTCELILTPHVKEFSRLTGMSVDTLLTDPIRYAEDYARQNNACILLKGPTTVITDGHDTYLTDAGCAGMATAGSGDVLSGILAAVCAYVGDPLLATAAGAYINGKAGEAAQALYGAVSMLAGDTVACIPQVIKALSAE